MTETLQSAIAHWCNPLGTEKCIFASFNPMNISMPIISIISTSNLVWHWLKSAVLQKWMLCKSTQIGTQKGCLDKWITTVSVLESSYFSWDGHKSVWVQIRI